MIAYNMYDETNYNYLAHSIHLLRGNKCTKGVTDHLIMIYTYIISKQKTALVQIHCLEEHHYNKTLKYKKYYYCYHHLCNCTFFYDTI